MTLPQQVKQQLIEAALLIRNNAYAPYSSYHVGAALLSESGEIFSGVNVENAVYSMTVCAERNALFQAVAQGSRAFLAIAVATDNGGTPCGGCRQVLSEFGPDIDVITVDSEGKVVLETKVSTLLPDAFGPEDLS